MRAAGTDDVRATIATLGTVDVSVIDMRTLVLIGARATRVIEATEGRRYVLTPRSEG